MVGWRVGGHIFYSWKENDLLPPATIPSSISCHFNHFIEQKTKREKYAITLASEGSPKVKRQMEDKREDWFWKTGLSDHQRKAAGLAFRTLVRANSQNQWWARIITSLLRQNKWYPQTIGKPKVMSQRWILAGSIFACRLCPNELPVESQNISGSCGAHICGKKTALGLRACSEWFWYALSLSWQHSFPHFSINHLFPKSFLGEWRMQQDIL